MIRFSKELINFNKEILFGEIGAIIGAITFSGFSSFITLSNSIVSFTAVIGAVLGAVLFWIIMRVYDQSREKKFSTKKFAGDIIYFSPVAFILTLTTYYPTLFFMSRYFLNHKIFVTFSVIASQFIAFLIFFILINLYRFIILKRIGRIL